MTGDHVLEKAGSLILSLFISRSIVLGVAIKGFWRYLIFTCIWNAAKS